MAAVVDTFTATSGASTASTTTLALTVPRAVAAGSKIILASSRADLSSQATGLASIVDSRGNTWHIGDAAALYASNEQVAVSSCDVTTGLQVGDTITVTWNSASARRNIVAHIATGLATGGAQATSGTALTAGTNSGPNGSGTAVTASTTTATTTAQCLVVAAVAVSNTAAVPATPGSGYTYGTNVATSTGSSDRALATEYQLTAAAGVQTAAATLPTSSTWAEAVAAYPASGTSSGLAVRGSALATNSNTLATSLSVTMPTAAVAGDLAVLEFLGSDDTWTDTGPAGWTLATTQGKNGITLKVWTKTVAGGDPGSAITVTSNNTSGYKRVLTVVVFSGAELGDVKSTTESTAGTSHTTPTVTAVDPTAWVLAGVADRASPGSQAWTLPAALTMQQENFGSGGGGVSTVSATASAVGSGTVGAYTITGTLSTATAVMWSMVIEPAGTTTRNTVDAGQDVTSEPRVALTRTATATGSPTGWAWTQTAGPTLTLSGAATATVSVTTPPNIAEQTYTLRATATYASGPAVSDDFKLTVFPVTKRFFAADGTEQPLRVSRFT